MTLVPILTAIILGAVLLPAQSSQTTPLGSHWRAVPRLQSQTPVMAYDPVRRVVVRFGGGDGHFGYGKPYLNRNHTWEWDGREWRLCEPLHRPSARSRHGMAFDPISKRVLLFGGGDGQKVFGDTWAWDGQDWTELKPLRSPSPRLSPAMASQGSLYLFGGGSDYVYSASGYSPSADTWRWTGANWVILNPVTSPPARGIPMGTGSLFACPKSRRLVLLGGLATPYNIPRETWEFDGLNWHRHNATPSFGAYGTGMPFVKTGDSLLLAYRFDTLKKQGYWLAAFWNGQSWKDSLVTPPVGFGGAAVANVDHLGEIVVTGSPSRSPYGPDHADVHTWTFDGANWKQRAVLETRFGYEGLVHDEARDETLLLTWPDWQTNPTHLGIRRMRVDGSFEKVATSGGPPLRTRFASLYHPGLRKVWLAGGLLPGMSIPPKFARDCWSWDGKAWQALNSTNTPDLSYTPCVYDGGRDLVVAWLRDGSFMGWDAKAGWSRLPAIILPPHRTGGALTYDAARQRLVVLTETQQSTNQNETWEYTGTTWIQIKTKTLPPPRHQHLMHYVPALGGILMFGGTSGPLPYRDSWLYDGKDWTKLAVEEYKAHYVGAPGRLVSSTYIVSRQRVLAMLPAGSAVEMLWEFDTKTLATTQPYPRPGESLILKAALPKQAGLPILFMMAGSDYPGIPLRTVPRVGVELLPLKPDALFLTSLSWGLVNVLDATGKASLPLRIPKLASLVGLQLHIAAVTLDLQGGFGAITNGVALRVVR